MLLKRFLERDYQWSEINANIIKKNNVTGGAAKSVQQDQLKNCFLFYILSSYSRRKIFSAFFYIIHANNFEFSRRLINSYSMVYQPFAEVRKYFRLKEFFVIIMI